ncbi:MAG: hypothetical protein AABX71_02085, partial [Nanoarchaeota archaeon]
MNYKKARKQKLSKKAQEAGIGIGKLILLIITILVLVFVILAMTIWKAKIADFFENLPGFGNGEDKSGGVGVE